MMIHDTTYKPCLVAVRVAEAVKGLEVDLLLFSRSSEVHIRGYARGCLCGLLAAGCQLGNP